MIEYGDLEEVVEFWCILPSDYSFGPCSCDPKYRVQRAWFRRFGKDYRIVHNYISGFFLAASLFDTQEDAETYHEYKMIKCICSNSGKF